MSRRRLRLALFAGYFATLVGFHALQGSADRLLRSELTFGAEVGHVARSLQLGQGFSFRFRGSQGVVPAALGADLGHLPVAGDAVATSLVTPLYPLLVAGLLHLFGPMTPAAAWAVIALNCLFQALALLAFEALCFRVLPTVGHAWAVALFALDHDGYVFSGKVWPQCLFVLAAILLVHRTLFPAPRRDALQLGLVSGLTLLVDKSGATLVALCALFRLARDRRRALRPLGVAALVAACLLLPWAVRNASSVGAFTPLNNAAGIVAWMGNSPGAARWSWSSQSGSFFWRPEEIALYARLGEQRYNRLCMERALEYIADDPARFAHATWRRAAIFWLAPEGLGVLKGGIAFGDLPPAMRFHVAWRAITLALAPIGLCLGLHSRRTRASTALLGGILAVYPLVYYVTISNWRYRSGIGFCVLLLAGRALGSLATRTRRCPDAG